MKREGYTIIEMLVVLAILGLILTLVVPRFAQTRPDASATALSLSSYLNSAANYAASHEQHLCLTLAGDRIRGSWEHEFIVPQGLSVAFPSFCYDQKGRIPSQQVIRITDAEDSSNAARVVIGAGYGNARPE